MVWFFAIHWISPPTVVAQPWTSFSQRPRSGALLRCTMVPIAALLLHCAVRSLHPTTCSAHARSICLSPSALFQPASPCLVCVIGRWFSTSAEPRLIAWHHSVMSAIASHPPDTPGRAPVLDSLFESLTQILCDSDSLVVAPRSAAARVCPRRRQPRWWNDDCFHALIARNGSWRDFRRSGSEADHSRFRVMWQQFRRIVLLGRLALQGTVSLPQRSQARFRPHPSDIPFFRSLS